jgi:ABC-type glycerol-3-phosphate transport system substrate-binding protein
MKLAAASGGGAGRACRALCLLVLTPLALSVSLGACARKGEGADRGALADGGSNSGPASTVPRKVRLSVLAGQSTPDPGIEGMIDDLLERELPDVELEWERVDWGDKFESQMQAKFAAGEVPDIMIGKAQDVATYLPSGNLAPIPPSVLRFVRKEALRSVSAEGRAFGAPYNAFYQGVFYNKDIFARLGLRPPRTREELDAEVGRIRAAGITPFAAEFGENWYAGNVVMQLAMGDVFDRVPDWGDKFRAGKVSFSGSKEYRGCILELQDILRESWPDALAIDSSECDERFANGEAAMYVTGSWTLQTVNVVNPGMKLGVFPFPNSGGDAKLLFEPNMTFMLSSRTDHPDEAAKVLEMIFGSRDLASEIFDFTRSSSLLNDSGTIIPLPIQSDVDRFRREERVADVTLGNTQLIWSFQQDMAVRLGEWLQGKASLSSALEHADGDRALSGPVN